MRTCARTHPLKQTHRAAQMSEAPLSVLNCNGPCQIKGKVFYVLRQTQLIFHQPWIHGPHWTAANSSVWLCSKVCLRVCTRVDRASTFIRNLGCVVISLYCIFSIIEGTRAHVRTHKNLLCESGWRTSRGCWSTDSVLWRQVEAGEAGRKWENKKRNLMFEQRRWEML